MSWFYEKRIFQSEKNGLITCVRVLGKWEVRVGGCYQSGPYIAKMWRRALRRIPQNARIKRVLMLGLGAGDCIELLQRRFPGCEITVVEWDPVMVDIAQRLRLYTREHSPRIIVDEVRHVIEQNKNLYDLVLFDLYQGMRAAPEAHQSSFAQAVTRVLAGDGYVLVNAYSEPQMFSNFDQFLSRWKTWKYLFNRLALYRPFGQGQVGDPLPVGYQPYRQNEMYLKREAAQASRIRVGKDGCYGFRWKAGLLWLEKYYSDEEPVIEPFAHRRLVIWQPITRTDRSSGWRRSLLYLNAIKTGFAEIYDGQVYRKTWSSHAQRHLRQWLKNSELEVAEVTVQEFLDVYRRVKQWKLFGIKESLIDVVRKKQLAHGDRVHCWIVRERTRARIHAGLCVLDIPEVRQSVHLISFIFSAARQNSAAVGLIDHWFQHAIKSDIRFLDFNLLWAPGDPRSWKGFSRFKSQFGIRYIVYPKPLIKLIKPEKTNAPTGVEA